MREGRAFSGLFPAESARLVETSFQGESKRAHVLLFPLRWDGSALVLSRRVVVRLDFEGREARETSLGGSRGRSPVPPCADDMHGGHPMTQRGRSSQR